MIEVLIVPAAFLLYWLATRDSASAPQNSSGIPIPVGLPAKNKPLLGGTLSSALALTIHQNANAGPALSGLNLDLGDYPELVTAILALAYPAISLSARVHWTEVFQKEWPNLQDGLNGLQSSILVGQNQIAKWQGFIASDEGGLAASTYGPQIAQMQSTIADAEKALEKRKALLEKANQTIAFELKTLPKGSTLYNTWLSFTAENPYFSPGQPGASAVL